MEKQTISNNPIAYGRTAEIYSWGDGQVIKLFYDWFSIENIQREQQIGKAVHASGLDVPAVGEIIRANECNGLVYELVNGINMWDGLTKKPWRLIYYARRMAKMHAVMHSSTIDIQLPTSHARIARKINNAAQLSASIKADYLNALARLPQSDRLCHGDFHPGNIMVSSDKEIIIDWPDCSLGNPLADVARTSVLILGGAATNQVPNLIQKTLVRLFHSFYLQHYFKLRPENKSEYRQWFTINAAARLDENIPELEHWLLRQVEEGLR